MNIALRYAARSDVGLIRSNNQDSGYAGPHLLVVADGMGGHAGGDVASSIALAHLAPLDAEGFGGDDVLAALTSALFDAQDELYSLARTDPSLAGLGTTVTALLRSGGKLAMVHIGDSRGYLLRDGLLTQVTTDHSFVQHLVDTGRLTPEEAEHHPQRSVVLRVLGDFDMEIVPDLSVREARPGDRWLLCSDGLSGVVSHDTLAETLAETADVGACADLLVQLALRGGAPDNVTCVVADVVDIDTLPDGQAPSVVPQVVGSAALRRNMPTIAGDGPAARAAGLRRETPQRQTEDAEDEAVARLLGRRRRWVPVVIVTLVLALVGAAGYAGFLWTRTQYFVGTSDGYVAVFQGIPQRIGPVELSALYETSELRVEDLPPYVQDRLAGTIHATDLDDARERIRILGEDVVAPTTPSATGATPSAGETSATGTPSPTGQP